MGFGSPTAQLEMDYASAATIARLLSMFSDLPSTPETIADEAAAAARDVAARLPVVRTGRSRQGSPGQIRLRRGSVVSCAGLLDVIAGMPSTPPDLREEAARLATELWDLLGAE